MFSKESPIELKIIVALALVAALYFASNLILPLVISALLALFSSPLVNLLSRSRLPKSLSAALVIITLSTVVSLGVGLLFTPASNWIERLPLVSEQLVERADQASDAISELKDNLTPEGKESSQQETASPDGGSFQSMIQSSAMTLLSVMAETTAMLLVQCATIIVVTYFLLVHGDDLMRSIVSRKNSITEKKDTFKLFETVRDEVSHYVLTISVINVLLGLAVTVAMFIQGVEDPILWGAMAGLLNFAPYVGTLIMSVLLTLVGFIEFDTLWQIVLVPVSFLILNLLEAQYITPTILGKRFNLNPLIVLIWMIFWGWLWGAAGALLAIPLLVCCKIITEKTSVFGNLLHSSPSSEDHS